MLSINCYFHCEKKKKKRKEKPDLMGMRGQTWGVLPPHLKNRMKSTIRKAMKSMGMQVNYLDEADIKSRPISRIISQLE